MNEPKLRTAAALLALNLLGVLAASSAADFTTVINVPSQPAPDFIASDTQLNIFGSGDVGDGFVAGGFDGASSHIEVNVHGGALGDNLSLNAGTTLNVYGGSVGDFGDAFTGSRVHIAGGQLGNFFDVNNGGHVRVESGSVGGGFDALSGGGVEIVGGSIGDGFNASPGSSIHILGKRFFLDATEITDSLVPGLLSPLSLRGVTLSGVLTDDTPFSFELNSDNAPLQDYFDPLADLSITLLDPADYDRSGIVDAADFTTWTQQYGSQGPHTADGNDNGRVDAADYTLWRDAVDAVESPSALSVPSPAALPLSALAALVMTLSPRRAGRASRLNLPSRQA